MYTSGIRAAQGHNEHTYRCTCEACRAAVGQKNQSAIWNYCGKSFGDVILFAERCDDEKEEIHITQKELEALSATGEQKNIKLSADGSYVTLCIQDFNGKMDEIPKNHIRNGLIMIR